MAKYPVMSTSQGIYIRIEQTGEDWNWNRTSEDWNWEPLVCQPKSHMFLVLFWIILAIKKKSLIKMV